MATKTPPKTKRLRSVAASVIWDVVLSDGDWYWVFARSKAEAVRVVQSTHYDSLSMGEFKKKFAPTVTRIPDHRKLLVNHDELGQKSKTARSWAKWQKPGPFVSNTYEA